MELRPTPAAALVLIDLQRGFFETEELAAQQTALVAAANELMARASARGVPIFVVVTEHAADRSTWTLSMRADDQGFNFAGTTQAALLPGLTLPSGVHTVRKLRDSAFHGTDLAQRLRLSGVSRLVLGGVESDNCVAHTGRDAFAHDFEVAFVVDAVGSARADRGAAALRDNRDELRQPLLTLDELDAWW